MTTIGAESQADAGIAVAATGERRGRARQWAAIALLVLAAALAYANSFRGAFVFDDRAAIVDNPTIRSFSPLWRPFVPPIAGSAGGRPIVNVSFAVNYAVGGLEPIGYHVTNLLIHIAAGLFLFGFVRRTAMATGAPPWIRRDALLIATGSALLWLVHPLQTESVTSIVQRTESLGSAFYLATLYAFVRATERNDRRWLIASGAACIVGAATKEILVTAPLIVMLYDRTFVAGSFANAWRQRSRYYLSLGASWLLLGVLLIASHARGGTAVLSKGVTVGMTLLTQARAVTTYLTLSLWPHPLVIDYGSYASDAVRQWSQVWPETLLIVTLLGATAFALWRRPRFGFLPASFFILLAPSSSVVPLLSQARAEHRMYLPLAAIIVVAVVCSRRALGRVSIVAVAVGAMACVVTTLARNRDYASPLSLWQATVRDFPSNPRAQLNLGNALRDAGDTDGAVRAYQHALHEDPNDEAAQANAAAVLTDGRHFVRARPIAEAAVREHPNSPSAHDQLARILLALGDDAGAAREAREAVRLDPASVTRRKNLALVLLSQGSVDDAIEQLRACVQRQPDAESWAMLGSALRQVDRPDEARAALESALALRPDDGMAQWQLGELFLGAGQLSAAVQQLTAAAKVMPRSVPVQLDLALALRACGRPIEATEHAEMALKLDPRNGTATELVRALTTEGNR